MPAFGDAIKLGGGRGPGPLFASGAVSGSGRAGNSRGWAGFGPLTWEGLTPRRPMPRSFPRKLKAPEAHIHAMAAPGLSPAESELVAQGVPQVDDFGGLHLPAWAVPGIFGAMDVVVVNLARASAVALSPGAADAARGRLASPGHFVWRCEELSACLVMAPSLAGPAYAAHAAALKPAGHSLVVVHAGEVGGALEEILRMAATWLQRPPAEQAKVVLHHRPV